MFLGLGGCRALRDLPISFNAGVAQVIRQHALSMLFGVQTACARPAANFRSRQLSECMFCRVL